MHMPPISFAAAREQKFLLCAEANQSWFVKVISSTETAITTVALDTFQEMVLDKERFDEQDIYIRQTTAEDARASLNATMVKLNDKLNEATEKREKYLEGLTNFLLDTTFT